MTAQVESIHIAEGKGAPTIAAADVTAVPGRGLEGDRYHRKAQAEPEQFKPKRQVTLIEAEALEALARVSLSAAGSRRTLCTRGIALIHLADRRFRVGAAAVRQVELCEPCGCLEKPTGKSGLRKAFVPRGGLRAEILRGERIGAGAAIRPLGMAGGPCLSASALHRRIGYPMGPLGASGAAAVRSPH